MPASWRGLADLPTYPFAETAALRRALEAAGRDVIDLGVGDADLSPPPAAVEALCRAAADPANSRYSYQRGLPEYREAIAAFMSERFSVQVDADREVLPLIGSKDGIFHLPLAYLEPGDAAILPDPGYPPYAGGTVLARGEPILVPLRAENRFLLDLDGLSADTLARARILVLNYPNNPTAAVAPPEYLERAVEICREHDILLAYDNAYSEIAFDGYRPPSILQIQGAKEVAIEFHSLSKTYNMTGWRIGWAAGPPAVIEALSRVKSFADTGVPFIIQHAAVAALGSRDLWLPRNVEIFRERRDVAVKGLRRAGIAAEMPQATMFVWAPVPEGSSSESFARRLLEEAGVVVLPGTGLGAGGEGFFRLALTSPGDRIEEAVARIGTVL